MSGALPFDVSSHPVAHTSVATDMLQRLATDMEGYAAVANDSGEVYTKLLTPLAIQTLCGVGTWLKANFNVRPQLFALKCLPSTVCP